MFAWLRHLLAPVRSPTLTWRAQWVFHAALRRARDRGVARADSDDLLYGLARTDEGVGRAILSQLGVSVEDLIGVGQEAIPLRRQRGQGIDTSALSIWSLACCAIPPAMPAACYGIAAHRFKRHEKKCGKSSERRCNHRVTAARINQ